MNDTNLAGHTLDPCSNKLPPLSEVFFMNISTAEKAVIGICGVLVLFTVIIYLEQIHYILTRYQTQVAVKRRTLEILGIYPAVSLAALASLCIPRASIICKVFNTIFISVSLCSYSSLMVLYFGGSDRLIWRLKEEKIPTQQPPCCCCCVCLPNGAVTVRNVRLLKALVLQYAVLQLVIDFVTLLLLSDEKYISGKYSYDNGFPYLSTVATVSSLLALYGVQLFFKLCKDHINPAYLVAKFMALQFVIVFCYLQDSVFAILASFNLPHCVGILTTDVRGNELLNMLLVFEMFFLSLFTGWLYRRPHDISSNLSCHEKQTEAVTSGHYVMDKMETSPSASSVHTDNSIVTNSYL